MPNSGATGHRGEFTEVDFVIDQPSSMSFALQAKIRPAQRLFEGFLKRHQLQIDHFEFDHGRSPTQGLVVSHAISVQQPRRYDASGPQCAVQIHQRHVIYFLQHAQPIILVDTKKKELVGGFKNIGRGWQPQNTPEKSLVHDFPVDATGKAIPYGVYDMAS